MSTLNFDKLKHIEQSQKDIVYGYIHEVQLLLPNDDSFYNIPSLVIFTCLAYYYPDEYFTKYNENIEINDKKDTICSSDDDVTGTTAYGNIDIIGTKYFQYEWEFEIIKMNDYVAIGIDSSGKSYTEDQFHDGENTNLFYAYESDSPFGLKYTIDGSYTYGNVALVVGDKIKMILNIKDKTLQYHINDKNQGIAFDDIDFSGNKIYNMAVMVYTSSVKLLNFQQYPI